MASETMPTQQPFPQFEHELSASTGVLVVNLGTPDAPTTTAVRRFLRQFLWDPHVIQYPRLAWWLILNLVILVIRPPRSAAAYRKIWTDQGSPLLVNSEALTNKLRDRLSSAAGKAIPVELAMTYGKPSITRAIRKLLSNDVRRVITLPLYPQYSATTTAAVFDVVSRELGHLNSAPESCFINDYHDSPGFISALAGSIRENWAENGRGEKLVMSFHGVPKRTLENGDPYFRQCQTTAALLADHLDLSDSEWIISFQSRVGREEWLTPYTDKTIEELGKQGISRLDVVCPGFAVDCLETLEEIAMQNAAIFSAAGGDVLQYVSALNSRVDHVQFLAELVEQQDWGLATKVATA